MRFLKTKARTLLCLLIILAFFLPAYQQTSAFRFLWVALSEVGGSSDVTIVDAMVLLLPLVLVPASALVLLVFAERRIQVRRVNVAMPLIFLAFFTALFYLSQRNSNPSLTMFGLMASMQAGFFLSILATLGLPFTKNPKRKRRRRRSHSLQPKTEPTPLPAT